MCFSETFSALVTLWFPRWSGQPVLTARSAKVRAFDDPPRRSCSADFESVDDHGVRQADVDRRIRLIREKLARTRELPSAPVPEYVCYRTVRAP